MNEDLRSCEDVDAFLAGWREDGNSMRRAFSLLCAEVAAMADVSLQFVGRPGVSYSLRPKHRHQVGRDLFAMIDVIDDNPSARWLSVCFYEDMITDPEGRGECIPGGLAGADGYCFDMNEYDDDLIGYLIARLREAASAAAT
ncbi:MAG: hypothetical protein A2X81_15565 [Desulfobacterales bacterium GWB2_56_26]|nr:MAG: hypothetical protein A2X81_15565 [Desulfobacterales bacterium GWB2_56_26]